MEAQKYISVLGRRMKAPLLMGAATLALSAAVGSANATTVYSNDFQTSGLRPT
jgi:hypothetical protein